MRASLLCVTILLCLTSCGEQEIESGVIFAETNVPFPHSEDFKQSKEHGKYFYYNTQICSKCHNVDFEQSQDFCNKCHGSNPHDETNLERHGSKYIASKKSCFVCHDTDDFGPNSCKECHSNYPHEKTWKQEHGLDLLNQVWPNGTDNLRKIDWGVMDKISKNNCLTCHKERLEATPELENYKCSSCHLDMPHSRKFVGHNYKTDLHHGDVIETKGASSCNLCHNSQLSDSDIENREFTQKQFCINCHGNENPFSSCMNCHWNM